MMVDYYKLFRFGIISFIVFSLLSLITVLYIDAPLAIFIHNSKLDNLLFLRYITEGFPFYIPIIYLLFLIFAKRSLEFGNKLVLIIYSIFLFYVAEYIHDFLKLIFGRYWPKTWKHNLSLINDNVFGFNWMGGINNQSSFPSGHSIFIVVTSVTMLIIFPKFKYLWLTLIAAMVISLVTLDYHFLGDCFAGIAVGSTVAMLGMSSYLKLYPIIIKQITQVRPTKLKS